MAGRSGDKDSEPMAHARISPASNQLPDLSPLLQTHPTSSARHRQRIPICAVTRTRHLFRPLLPAHGMHPTSRLELQGFLSALEDQDDEVARQVQYKAILQMFHQANGGSRPERILSYRWRWQSKCAATD